MSVIHEYWAVEHAGHLNTAKLLEQDVVLAALAREFVPLIKLALRCLSHEQGLQRNRSKSTSFAHNVYYVQIILGWLARLLPLPRHLLWHGA